MSGCGNWYYTRFNKPPSAVSSKMLYMSNRQSKPNAKHVMGVQERFWLNIIFVKKNLLAGGTPPPPDGKSLKLFPSVLCLPLVLQYQMSSAFTFWVSHIHHIKRLLCSGNNLILEYCSESSALCALNVCSCCNFLSKF